MCAIDNAAFVATGHLQLPPVSYSLFEWAVFVLMSRQNRIPSKSGGGSIIALIPGWDCCNHRQGEMKTFFNPAEDVSEAATMEAVPQGSPIYLHYGDRPNSKLFLYQGFVIDANANDTYTSC